LVASITVYTQSSAKFAMTLHIESLCPDSTFTAVKSFKPAIEKGLLEMVDLTLNVAGNVKETVDHKTAQEYFFTCQNGVEECWGNFYENCMLKHTKDQVLANNAVICVYENTNADKNKLVDAFMKCFKDYDLDHDTINDCVVNGEANHLMHAAAQRTPKHNNIPWNVVEGHTLSQDDQTQINKDVFSWACKNYPGKKPASCFDSVKTLSIVE